MKKKLQPTALDFRWAADRFDTDAAQLEQQRHDGGLEPHTGQTQALREMAKAARAQAREIVRMEARFAPRKYG